VASLTKSVIEHPTKQRVLILGGGFGGAKVALIASENANLDVTLISDQENFRYYPTIYRAAVGGTRASSMIPLSEIFNGKPVHVIKDSVKTLDRNSKIVLGTSGKKYPYEKLIIALGSVTNYFGIKGLDKYSYGVKSFEEARKLRDHLHRQLLDENVPDANYIIVGGGPTGVELAGAMTSYMRHITKKHKLKSGGLNIELVEAAPRILPNMPEAYSRTVQKKLQKLGVELILGKAVKAETADNLMVGDKPIKSRTVIWTAGVTNHPFLSANKLPIGEHGKVAVDEYLQAEPGIYVIGDNAATPYSGMAQTALYDGEFMGSNLKRMAAGQAPEKYNSRRPVYITPAGHIWAAVLWGKIQLYGKFAYMLRDLADFIGFHDLEPWLPASKHWLAQFDGEEDCQVCKKK